MMWILEPTLRAPINGMGITLPTPPSCTPVRQAGLFQEWAIGPLVVTAPLGLARITQKYIGSTMGPMRSQIAHVSIFPKVKF